MDLDKTCFDLDYFLIRTHVFQTESTTTWRPEGGLQHICSESNNGTV